MLKRNILVVGAAHLDVIAKYTGDSRYAETIDKPGEIVLSLGGTAFNIATNTANSKSNTYLITAISNNTFIGKYLRTVCQQTENLNDKFCFSYDGSKEQGGFVGIFRDWQDLDTAISQTLIESEEIGNDINKCIDRAMKYQKKWIVVADCNLSDSNLNYLLKVCHEYEQPILVAGVSESKSIRILDAFTKHSNRIDKCKVEVFSANVKEVGKLLEENDERRVNEKRFESSCHCYKPADWYEDEERVEKICSDLHVKYLIVTDGPKGYYILTENGQGKHIQATEYQEVINSAGAGDALLAGIATYFSMNWKPDWTPQWDDCNRYVQPGIERILKQREASILDYRIPSITKIFANMNPINKRVSLTILVALIIVVFICIIVFISSPIVYFLLILLVILILSVLYKLDVIDQSTFENLTENVIRSGKKTQD